MLLGSRSRLRSAIHLPYCERGQTIIEYALIIAAIAVLLIVGMVFLGGKVNDQFHKSGSSPPGTLRPPTAQCDPNYGGACVPPYPPDLDCPDLRALGLALPVSVVGGDPHGLDPDGDGLGC
jgi:Flp pilus assembly pilin Flp